MRDTIQTVATAALTAFLIGGAAGYATPHPVPAPAGTPEGTPIHTLEQRVDELQAQVFGLRAKFSCISLTAIETPDINGAPHPLVKWRKRCLA